MQITDYKYASNFIEKRKSEVNNIRRMRERMECYFELSRNISSRIKLIPVTSSYKESLLEKAITEKIEFEKKEKEAIICFRKNCETLYRIKDINGAYIIYKYVILGTKMEEVSREIKLSKSTCFRHLRNAISELDYCLKKLNYK